LKNILPYINIHTHSPGAEGISIYNQDPAAPLADQLISIGIHPWHIKKHNIAEVLDLIRKNSARDNVKAIGECGLDRLSDTPLSEQEQLFKEQVQIAIDVKKPLIIHCVKAFDDLIRIKKEMRANVPFIVHGYNNNLQIAEQLLRNDFYLSFGKALLREESNAQETMMITDTSRFFLETDDAAIPINSIFEKAAELKKISVEELKETITLNFKLLFNHG
jgi:TatD DNase family protein